MIIIYTCRPGQDRQAEPTLVGRPSNTGQQSEARYPASSSCVCVVTRRHRRGGYGQNAGPHGTRTGISSSCHGSAQAWWCCGSAAERCHRCIEIGLLRSDAGAEIAQRRRERHSRDTSGSSSVRSLHAQYEEAAKSSGSRPRLDGTKVGLRGSDG